MYCYHCGSRLSDMDFCTACGTDVKQYKIIMYAANRFYNDGLERAGVRDLSGAISSLNTCLRLNRKHTDALNLLGLIYYEMGECVQALSAWVLSLNIQSERNIAMDYVESIQSNQTRIDSINKMIKKYNKTLDYCYQESFDLAVLQLRKVININPKFFNARKLLALLYMQNGEWNKANSELERCQKINNGDIDVRRYLCEVDRMLHPVEEKNGKKGKKKQETKENAIYSMSGNDIIIQPINEREPFGIQSILLVVAGLVVGLLITLLLITPARVSSTRKQMEAQITAYGEQLDTKNAEIDAMQSRITLLEQSNMDLQESAQSFSQQDGTLNVTNSLIAAAYAFLDPAQSNMAVEQYLNNISDEYLSESASPEFLALYSHLMAQIGDSVASTYYESGIEAYNERDYALAISNLQKAYLYNAQSDEALYYLGLAYYESGDVINATSAFQDLMNFFPNSTLVENARRKLEEIAD